MQFYKHCLSHQQPADLPSTELSGIMALKNESGTSHGLGTRNMQQVFSMHHHIPEVRNVPRNDGRGVPRQLHYKSDRPVPEYA